MSSLSPQHLLRQAISAARQGDRSQGRMFLAKLTELHPEEALGWLWRAGLADTPEQALVWVSRVLDIDPQQPNARRALPKLRIQAALAVARDGDYATARELLYMSAEADPDSIIPWLELAGMSQSTDEVRVHLDEVLRREPNHAGARKCLAKLDEQQKAFATTPTPLSIEIVARKPESVANDSANDRLIPVAFEPPPDFAVATAAEDSAHRATVLVVDDNRDVRAFVHRHLEPFGVRVMSAEGADEAIALLGVNAPPDLILIDADMPDIDGRQLCAMLRQERDTAGLPMILLSVGGSRPTKGMMSGFNDAIPKPISPSSLRAVVSKYCDLVWEDDADSAEWPELPEEVLR